MTTTAKTYRVTWPLIQVAGHAPYAGKGVQPERTLRGGDILPAWVPTDEIERLTQLGALEVAK